MRNLKTIFTMLAISLATTFSTNASEKTPSEITKEIRKEIISILGSKISLELKESSTAEISFLINNDNEIVIISVNSKIENLNAFVKQKLNYKKIALRGVKKGEVYKMPLKITIN